MRAQKNKNKTDRHPDSHGLPLPGNTCLSQCFRLFYSLEFSLYFFHVPWLHSTADNSSAVGNFRCALRCEDTAYWMYIWYTLSDSILVPVTYLMTSLLSDRILHILGSPQILYVVEASLQVLILPPAPPKCWDHSLHHVPPHPILMLSLQQSAWPSQKKNDKMINISAHKDDDTLSFFLA